MKRLWFRTSFVLAAALSMLTILMGCRGQESVDQATATVAVAAQPTATLAPTVQATATPAPTVKPRGTYTNRFERSECQFDEPYGVDIDCGYVVVPEDRERPERTIRLHVAVVASNSDTPAPDPVVFLMGGPGGHLLNQAGWIINTLDPILETRDLILYDQRGVGFSEPSLNCPEVEEAYLAHVELRQDEEDERAATLAAYSDCRDRLVAEGIDLSAYNSAASADDLEALRLALGYDQWNLLGFSYGTRLALTTLREYGHTGTIRSVILDSAYPPQVDGSSEWWTNAKRAFDLLFARCAALEMCAEAYPDLEERFYGMVDELNSRPITATVSDRVNARTLHLPLDGDLLVWSLRGMMYESNLIINLPKMLDQLEARGRSSILNEFLSRSLRRQEFSSEGMFYAVQCAEDFQFIDATAFEEESEALPAAIDQIAGEDMETWLQTCELLQVPEAAPVAKEAVVSEVPTLILMGDFDPITPPAYGLAAAEHLENSIYLEFEGIGHGVLFSTQCGVDIAASFLAEPQTAPEANCLDQMYFGFVTR